MGKPENIFDPVFAYAISLMNSIQWFSLNKVFLCGSIYIYFCFVVYSFMYLKIITILATLKSLYKGNIF